MNWNIVFGAQAVLASGALYFATLWPVTGGAAVLVPVFQQDKNQLWQWMRQEDAAMMQVDGGTVVVQVPSQSSLWRAIGKGFLPVSAKPAVCVDPQAAIEGSNSIS
ncbi:hypothetical protein INR77_09900 [Erythrobacter sp. SCSIO 43205]|uniref:hypothetical protein n=1 Tax=Erythrobacter sp. SCSIO 43205 TaxID=2779361 RepID=UPI001CA8B665|nr:hypothetical protein [Erythrobacter sp. SCSIO 43205]UAB77140.1 hypothetical protein INR77_09900 [Erythrobacter sp. SCSIO 43205]